MCRWLAYLGSPMTLDTLLTKPDHSLLDQSLDARRLYLPGMAIADQFRNHDFPTNGDGFGVAWQGLGNTIGTFHEITPAWDSKNLLSLAPQIESGAFLAHVRAAPGGSVAEDNCHPFTHDGWMFQHNGGIGGFPALKRDLTMDVDPDLYPYIRGNSDTEVMFYLALTYGLNKDPVEALLKLNARIEKARVDHNVTEPFTGTIAASNGTKLIVMRISSRTNLGGQPAPESPSLYYSSGPDSITTRDGSPEKLPEDAQVVVSEPPELHYSTRTWHPVEDRTISVLERNKTPLTTVVPV